MLKPRKIKLIVIVLFVDGWEAEHGKCIVNILRKYPNAAYLGKFFIQLAKNIFVHLNSKLFFGVLSNCNFTNIEIVVLDFS